MSATLPGIKIKADIRLKIDWKGLSKSLADVTVHGIATLFGKIDSGPSSVAALGGIFTSISVDADPGERAWTLVWLSVAWAIDDLRSSIDLDLDATRIAINDILHTAKESVDSGDEIISVNFFRNPTSLPLYEKIRDAFVSKRETLSPETKESAVEFSARFDACFSLGVMEILLTNPESYKILIQSIEIENVSAPGIFELQWSAYRSKLQHDFDVKPMFGQDKSKISLGQAYVPLRCEWKDVAEDDADLGTNNIDILDNVLMAWVDKDCTPESSVKLIGGGPGSGKSTSAKKLARDLSKKSAVRPLYIPLQHINLEGPLRDSINVYFTERTNSPFTHPPLAREAIESGPPLILICDGLDEIARPGEGADDVANLFISKLDQLQSSLKGDSQKEIKVIVTGRLPSFQAAKKFKGALGPSALQVLGYGPADDLGNNSDIANIDQRPLWWSKFSPLANLPATVPAALVDDRLQDVTNEPLLCYLLVLSGFALENWKEAADNRNLIYQKLIDEVWLRGWGEYGKQSDRQGPGRHLTKSQFNDLMETIALAAWLGGDTRVASDSGFRDALKLTHAEAAWTEFCTDGGEDVANLAMNFYLKAAEDSKKGFEFTHKSFGDYLAARSIIGMAFEIAPLVDRYPDLALQAWLVSTSTGVMTGEILNYIRDEFRLSIRRIDRGDKKIYELFFAFQKLAKIVLLEGLPAHNINGQNWRSIAKFQRNSEVTLWAVLHSAGRALKRFGEDICIDVGFDDDKSLLKSFISRVVIGDEEHSPILSCLSNLKATHADLFGLNLSEADFSGGKLAYSNFNGTHLLRANMTNCDLKGCRFQRANLDNASFSNSNLDGADFKDSRINSCDLFTRTKGDFRVSERTLTDVSMETEIPEDRISFINVPSGNISGYIKRHRRAMAVQAKHLAERKTAREDRSKKH